MLTSLRPAPSTEQLNGERRQSHATLAKKVKQKNLSKLRHKYLDSMKTPTADELGTVLSFDAYKSRKASNATSMVADANKSQETDKSKPKEDALVEQTKCTPQMFAGTQAISLKSPTHTTK